MPYYRPQLTLSETSDYGGVNTIIVDTANAITGSTCPTTVISHTAGSTSVAESWTIQIGNSTHYLVLTSGTPGRLDIYMTNYTNTGNVQTSYQSYTAGYIVIPVVLWSTNTMVVAYTGQNTTAAAAYFIGTETTDWYGIWFNPSSLYVYHNADDSTQSYTTFTLPTQLTPNVIVQQIILPSSNLVVDLTKPIIGYTNANNNLYNICSVNPYGTYYFFWYSGFVVSDEI